MTWAMNRSSCFTDLSVCNCGGKHTYPPYLPGLVEMSKASIEATACSTVAVDSRAMLLEPCCEEMPSLITAQRFSQMRRHTCWMWCTLVELPWTRIYSLVLAISLLGAGYIVSNHCN